MSNDLEIAYSNHKSSLLAIALNITHCPELAEDAIQNAFSKLVRSNGQVKDLKAYLFKTVRNSAIDIIRSQSRENQKMEGLFAETASSFASGSGPPESANMDGLIRIEEMELLKAAIQNLPTDDREILLLKIFSNFTFERIAEITQSNASTVATRYRRLLQKIKTNLKEFA